MKCVLTLELAKMPRGASTFKASNLDQLKNQTKFINLFKTRRTKGWYALKFLNAQNQKAGFAGTVELEFDLMRKEDAETTPVGFGRDQPQGLPKPKRPETSFSWILNPLAAGKYLLKSLRKKVIKVLIYVAIVIVVIIIVYTIWKILIGKLISA